MAGDAKWGCRLAPNVAVTLVLLALVPALSCFSLQGLSKKLKQKDIDEAALLEVRTGTVIFDEKRPNSLGSRFATGNGGLHAELDELGDTEQGSLLKNAADHEPAWRRLSPTLYCSQSKMKLKAMGPGVRDLQLDMGNGRLLPLSQVPESCGYSMRQNALGLVLLVPFDGCNVIQEKGNYVLPLRWRETPARCVCPKLPDTAPASPSSKTALHPWQHPFPHGPWNMYRRKRQTTQPISIYDRIDPYSLYNLYYMNMMAPATTTATTPATTTTAATTTATTPATTTTAATTTTTTVATTTAATTTTTAATTTAATTSTTTAVEPDMTTVSTNPTTQPMPTNHLYNPYYLYYLYLYQYYSYYPLARYPVMDTTPPATTPKLTGNSTTEIAPPTTTASTTPSTTASTTPSTTASTTPSTTASTTPQTPKPYYPPYFPYFPYYPYYHFYPYYPLNPTTKPPATTTPTPTTESATAKVNSTTESATAKVNSTTESAKVNSTTESATAKVNSTTETSMTETTTASSTKATQKTPKPYNPLYFPHHLPYDLQAGQPLPQVPGSSEIFYYPIIQHFYGRHPQYPMGQTSASIAADTVSTAKPTESSSTKPTTAKPTDPPSTKPAPSSAKPTDPPSTTKPAPSSAKPTTACTKSSAYTTPKFNQGTFIPYYENNFAPSVDFKAGRVPHDQKYLPHPGYKSGFKAQAHPHPGFHYWQRVPWFPHSTGEDHPQTEEKLHPKSKW